MKPSAPAGGHATCGSHAFRAIDPRASPCVLGCNGRSSRAPRLTEPGSRRRRPRRAATAGKPGLERLDLGVRALARLLAPSAQQLLLARAGCLALRLLDGGDLGLDVRHTPACD